MEFKVGDLVKYNAYYNSSGRHFPASSSDWGEFLLPNGKEMGIITELAASGSCEVFWLSTRKKSRMYSFQLKKAEKSK